MGVAPAAGSGPDLRSIRSPHRRTPAASEESASHSATTEADIRALLTDLPDSTSILDQTTPIDAMSVSRHKPSVYPGAPRRASPSGSRFAVAPYLWDSPTPGA